MRNRVALAAALAVGIAVVWLATRERAPLAIEDPGARRTEATIAPDRAPADVHGATSPPPASLRDSDVDGALAVDADGRFAPNAEAIALFDYFLSARGEESDEAIRARIDAEIARRLAPAAADEARAFLARYLAYRSAAAELADDPSLAASADLERRLQWLRELRREHFGATLAATLFGDEERATETALAQRRILEDDSLTDAERARRLAALEVELPGAVREAREAATLPTRLAAEERALRAAGGDAAALRALREERVGADAADRLEALDARRAEWEARLAAYRAERDALPAAERESSLEALRARHFDERERLRVRALDEIEAATGAADAR